MLLIMVYGAWSGLSLARELLMLLPQPLQEDSESGEIGTIVKMSRVLMLAPVSVYFLSCQYAKNADSEKR